MSRSNGPDRRDEEGAERGADTMGGSAARQVVTDESETRAAAAGSRAPGPDPPPGEPGPMPDPGDVQNDDIRDDWPMNVGSEDTAAPAVDPAEYRLGGTREAPEPEP
jgi:hypothetical protein